MMIGTEKLFEIGRTIDGSLEYFYNRRGGEKPIYLLTVYKDGTIHIVKDIIHSPDIVVALISALKHAIVFMRDGRAFAPVLDDYVELFVDMWQKEHQKLFEGGEDDERRKTQNP